MGALDQVITIYDSSYVSTDAESGLIIRKERQKSRDTIEIDTQLGRIEPTSVRSRDAGQAFMLSQGYRSRPAQPLAIPLAAGR